MRRPWMPLYISDYLADTAHLRAAQSGAYLHLIMHYWQMGSLPDDDLQLSMIAKMPPAEWRKTKPIIAAFFEIGWKHNRIDQEIVEAEQKYERRAAAGRKGGASKQCSSNAKAGLNQPQPQPQRAAAADAEAREPLISLKAINLSNEIAVLCGHNLEFLPPSWCGAPLRIQTWFTNGWQTEIALIAVRAALAKRKTGPPINFVQFFEPAIADEHARQAKPIPKTEVSSVQNNQSAGGRSGPGGGFARYASDLAKSAGS